MISPKTAKNNNIKTIDSSKTLASDKTAMIEQLKALLPEVINSDEQLNTKALADVVDMANTTAEKQKINYGKKFFDALQRELPKIEIKYRTWINGRDLSELLEIGNDTIYK